MGVDPLFLFEKVIIGYRYGMKRILLIILLVLSLFGCSTNNQTKLPYYVPQQDIHWQTSFWPEGRPMPALLYFSSDDCGYCLEMEENTLSDPIVVNMINGLFIPLLIKDNEDYYEDLVTKYDVRSLPCIIILAYPEYEKKLIQVGLIKPELFVPLLKLSLHFNSIHIMSGLSNDIFDTIIGGPWDDRKDAE